MRSILLVAAALVAVPMVVQAQGIPEVRPFVGAFIPTGDQADVLDGAVLTGAEVAVEAADMLHVVGTFAFTGPKFDTQVVNSGHMHVFQFDVGGELASRRTIPPDTARWERSSSCTRSPFGSKRVTICRASRGSPATIRPRRATRSR